MLSKIYCSYELARLTTGYDAANKRTSIRVWSLAVAGPADLSASGLSQAARAEGERILRSAAEQALGEAAVAGYAAPGELSVKLGVAWQVFVQRFPVLVRAKAEAAIQAFVDAFSIGLHELVVLQDGLVLDASAGKATSEIYRKVHEQVRGVVGGDVGRAVDGFFDLLNRYHSLQSVELKIRAPREVVDALAEAARTEQALRDVAQRAVDFSAAVDKEVQELKAQLDELPDKASREAQRLMTDIERVGGERLSATVAEVGRFSQNVCRQLEMAGVRIQSLDPAALRNLPVGLPRVDLTAAGELGAKLTQASGAILSNLGQGAAATAQEVYDELASLKQAIERAIEDGASEVVDELKKQFDARVLALDAAQASLSQVEQQLRAGNFTAVADRLADEAATLAQNLTGLQTVVRNAPDAVAARVAELAKQAYEAALRAAEEALNAVANGIRRALGF